jgi:hypothetical protein
LISGCSIYESDGRKFLEDNAIQLHDGTLSSSNVKGWGPTDSTTAWVSLEKTPQAEALVNEGSGFELQVTPLAQSQSSCFFQFSSEQERNEKLAAAIDYSLHQSPAQ